MRVRTEWRPARRVIACLLLVAGACAGATMGPGIATADDALTLVGFRFRAPADARVVTVAGTFNDWNPGASPLSDPDGDGVWEATLRIVPGTHQYKFVVGGTDWFTDETADAFVDDGFGGRNSVVEIGTEPVTIGDRDGAADVVSGVEIVFTYRPPDVAPADRVNSVSVAGSFNDWNAAAHVMTDHDGDGVWEIAIRLDPGGYTYQLVIDGERWIADPLATELEEDGFGGWRSRLGVAVDSTSAPRSPR